jgi:hypothetical protein
LFGQDDGRVEYSKRMFGLASFERFDQLEEAGQAGPQTFGDVAKGPPVGVDVCGLDLPQGHNWDLGTVGKLLLGQARVPPQFLDRLG